MDQMARQNVCTSIMHYNDDASLGVSVSGDRSSIHASIYIRATASLHCEFLV